MYPGPSMARVAVRLASILALTPLAVCVGGILAASSACSRPDAPGSAAPDGREARAGPRGPRAPRLLRRGLRAGIRPPRGAAVRVTVAPERRVPGSAVPLRRRPTSARRRRAGPREAPRCAGGNRELAYGGGLPSPGRRRAHLATRRGAPQGGPGARGERAPPVRRPLRRSPRRRLPGCQKPPARRTLPTSARSARGSSRGFYPGKGTPDDVAMLRVVCKAQHDDTCLHQLAHLSFTDAWLSGSSHGAWCGRLVASLLLLACSKGEPLREARSEVSARTSLPRPDAIARDAAWTRRWTPSRRTAGHRPSRRATPRMRPRAPP